MQKQNIGRLLLSLLTAFVMVVGVFGAAVYTDSQTWGSVNPSVPEMVVAGEHEDRTSGIGEAPISADQPTGTIASFTATEENLDTKGDSTQAISLLDLGILPPPSQPEQKKEIEISANADSSSTEGTRAPGDTVTAYGPYGTITSPEYEGNPIDFDADIVPAGTDDNDDYKFRWDVTGDGVFDGPGTAPDFWGADGETEYTHMFLDNNVGMALVQAWDGTFTTTAIYGDALSTIPMINGHGYGNNECTFGNEMTANEDITITAIGFYRGDMFGEYIPYHAHRLAVWEWGNTVTPLREVIDPLPNPLNEWLYYSITPLDVSAGTQIMVSLCANGVGLGGVDWVALAAHETSSPDGLIAIGNEYGWNADGYPIWNQGTTFTAMVDIQYEQIKTVPNVLEDEAEIFVDNVAPIGLDPQATVSMGYEGSDVGFTASMIDPGLDDDWEYRWDFGDGTVSNWYKVNKWAGGARILVAQSYYQNELDDIADYLQNILGPFATQIDTWNPGPAGTDGIPELDDLLPYDVVISAENVIMTLPDRIALGTVLADYSDMGGNVVTTWVSDADDIGWGEIGLLGRWRDEVYNIFIPDDLDFSTYNLGTVYDPGHPIMQGVNSINTYLSTWAPDVEADATRLADDTYGEPIIGYKDSPSGSGGRIVGINLIPHSGYASGDFDQLLANAVKWASQQPDPAPVFLLRRPTCSSTTM